ncbi:MAG: DUF1540 domain-containing protein [Bacilli bacterium]|nr:DUF1540 domain-containing protein [Bacilli bacterium]
MEKEEYFNQRIGCTVHDCKYHDGNEDHCTLGKILVSGENNQKGTFCASFESRN